MAEGKAGAGAGVGAGGGARSPRPPHLPHLAHLPRALPPPLPRAAPPPDPAPLCPGYPRPTPPPRHLPAAAAAAAAAYTLRPADRQGSWNLPRPDPERRSPSPPQEPSPSGSCSLRPPPAPPPQPRTPPQLPAGLERIVITLKAPHFTKWAELVVTTTCVQWEGQSFGVPTVGTQALRHGVGRGGPIPAQGHAGEPRTPTRGAGLLLSRYLGPVRGKSSGRELGPRLSGGGESRPGEEREYLRPQTHSSRKGCFQLSWGKGGGFASSGVTLLSFGTSGQR